MVTLKLIAPPESQRPCIRKHNDSYLSAHASFGGLLHDIGKLVINSLSVIEASEMINKTTEGKSDQSRSGNAGIGVNHAAVGAYLSSLWGYHHPVVEAISFIM